MVSFIESRLLDSVEKGSRGGPGFNTTILELASGHEVRNRNWSKQRCKYNIGYGISNSETWGAVLSAFYVCGGRATGFRFRDWGDYRIGKDEPQSIGFGTVAGITDFQIFKTYDFGSQTYNREINKIVTGTLSVYVNDVLATISTDYNVDMDTGLISFTAAKFASDEVKVVCEFDVPVRFDVDELPIEMQTTEAGAVPSIPLVELRVNNND